MMCEYGDWGILRIQIGDMTFDPEPKNAIFTENRDPSSSKRGW